MAADREMSPQRGDELLSRPPGIPAPVVSAISLIDQCLPSHAGARNPGYLTALRPCRGGLVGHLWPTTPPTLRTVFEAGGN